MVIVRKGDAGKVEILLIDYTIGKETTKRCLMGRQEGTDESPIGTLKREMYQEALEDGSSFQCRFAGPKPVVLTDLVDDQFDQSGYHLKIFFLTEITEGVLRTEVLKEEDGLVDEFLGPPKYHDIEESLDKFASGEWKSKWVHVKAVKSALLALAESDAKIRARYSRAVETYCHGVNQNPLGPNMIREYLNRFR
jgi:hypothetical protein